MLSCPDNNLLSPLPKVLCLVQQKTQKADKEIRSLAHAYDDENQMNVAFETKRDAYLSIDRENFSKEHRQELEQIWNCYVMYVFLCLFKIVQKNPGHYSIQVQAKGAQRNNVPSPTHCFGKPLGPCLPVC